MGVFLSAGLLFGVAAGAPVGVGGRCTIIGTPGPDVLIGTSRDDVICGLGGNDVLRGGGGDDVLRGGAGNDRLRGGAGDDVVHGGRGRDLVRGGRATIASTAAAGDDIVGGRGDPSFVDDLFCGPGVDRALADTPDRVRASCENVSQNHAPTDLSLSATSVAENQPPGTVVGRISVTDADAGTRTSSASSRARGAPPAAARSRSTARRW